MTATVIDLTKRRSDLVEHQDRAYLARLFAAPAYMALPFVTLKKDADGLGAFSEGESYWNDVPTDDCAADQEFARWCFADPQHAASFQALFGGEPIKAIQRIPRQASRGR